MLRFAKPRVFLFVVIYFFFFISGYKLIFFLFALFFYISIVLQFRKYLQSIKKVFYRDEINWPLLDARLMEHFSGDKTVLIGTHLDVGGKAQYLKGLS